MLLRLLDMAWAPMADHGSALKFEFQELLLVAMGAVPGALLRWQVALHFDDQNLLANILLHNLLLFLLRANRIP